MKLEVVTREDLNKVLEQVDLPEYSGSLTALLKSQIASYDPAMTPYLSLYLNGRKVERRQRAPRECSPRKSRKGLFPWTAGRFSLKIRPIQSKPITLYLRQDFQLYGSTDHQYQ